MAEYGSSMQDIRSEEAQTVGGGATSNQEGTLYQYPTIIQENVHLKMRQHVRHK